MCGFYSVIKQDTKAYVMTDRLVLRSWHEKDTEPFAALNSDPEVMEFFPALVGKHKSMEFMERCNSHLKEHGFTLWAVEIRENGPLIGMVGLAHVEFQAPFSPAVEIGWRLARQHWGQGYATEAAQASLQFGFDRIGLDEIVAMTVPDNARSRAVMERLGMVYHPEADFDHPKIPDGHALKRHVLYRIKRDDWIAKAWQRSPVGSVG